MTLEIKDLSKSFGQNHIIRSMSLVAGCGLHHISGGNGSGKSTLLKCVSGFERQNAGSIRLGQRDLDRLAPFERARLGVFFASQKPLMFPDLTVAEHFSFLASQPVSFHFDPSLQRLCSEQEDELLELSGLSSKLGSPAGEISIGQRKILQLICASKRAAGCYLLDEPMAGVSEVLENTVRAILNLFARQSIVIVAEHRSIFEPSDYASSLKVESGTLILRDESVA